MAATVHGHEPQQAGEAIGVTNEFMHDVMIAGIKDHLEKLDSYNELDDEGKALEVAQLEQAVRSNLVMGSLIQVGEQTTLYTAKLGNRSGQAGKETFSEGVCSAEEFTQFRENIYHNGFTVGPQHLIDQWSRNMEVPENLIVNVDQMMMGKAMRGVDQVVMPADTSSLARFATAQDFTQTTIFQDFKALGQRADAPAYVKVTASATAAMLEGLQNTNAHQTFTDKGLDPMLQLTYNRMQACMQKASACAGDPAQFNQFISQIDQLQEQMSNVLAVARPFEQGQFNTVMQGATDLLPENFSPEIQPQYALKNTGLRSLSAALTGVEELKGGQKLNIAMQKDCYYESGFAVAEAMNHQHVTLDGDNIEGSINHAENVLAEGKLDLYVAEFHHNISISRHEYHAEDVTAQVDRLFEKGLVSDRFTVALDTTIATTDAQEIKAFLAHNEERIREGKLNVVMYRSGQKFDQMGMDNYNGGIMVTVNDGKSFTAFDKAVNEGVGRGVDKLGSLSEQGFTLIQQHAQSQLNDYRRAVMSATAQLSQPQAETNPLGLPPTMFLTPELRGAAMIQLAPNQDDRAVFLDLRNPWMEQGSDQAGNFNKGIATAMIYLSKVDPENFHMEGRASFGFVHSNITLIGGDKFRFNPGLEDAATLGRYRDAMSSLNDVFMKSKADYPSVDDFNAINEKLTDTNRIKGLTKLIQQQMKVNAGQDLTVDERIEAAAILHEVGNQRGAARALDQLSGLSDLTQDQTERIQAARALVSANLTQSPQEWGLDSSTSREQRAPTQAPVNTMHAAAAEARALLRQGVADNNPQTLLAALGKAQEASIQLGTANAQQRISALLVAELKTLPTSQLETTRDTAARLAALLPASDPQHTLLSNVSRLADQDLALRDAYALGQPQAARTEQQITEAYVLMADARQRPLGSDNPTPQTTMGDLYASYNYFDEHPTEMQGPGQLDGDLIIARDGDTPQAALIHAMIGPADMDRAGIQAAFNDPKVTETLKKAVESLPPEQRTIYISNAVGEMNKKMDRNLRAAYASYDGMIQNAAAGKDAKFAQSAREFESSLAQMRQESQFMADLLRKPALLAQMPPEHRAALQALGNQAQAINHELTREGGFGQISTEFASLAARKPEAVIREICDTQLAQNLRHPIDAQQVDQNDVEPEIIDLAPGHDHPVNLAPANDLQPLQQPPGQEPEVAVEVENHAQDQVNLPRRNSVRDLMKQDGAVSKNPFKIRDEQLKAEKQELSAEEKAPLKRTSSVGSDIKIGSNRSSGGQGGHALG